MTENPYVATECHRPALSNAAQRIRRYVGWIAVGVIAVVLLVLLTPIATVAVWDGSFELTIHEKSDPTVDLESIRFTTCWRQADAAYLVSQKDDRWVTDWSNAVRAAAQNHWTIDVRCSGRTGWTGIGDSYVEPRFLVVEYESTTGEESTMHRKQFTIPKGRGPRSMTIELP